MLSPTTMGVFFQNPSLVVRDETQSAYPIPQRQARLSLLGGSMGQERTRLERPWLLAVERGGVLADRTDFGVGFTDR